MRVLTAHHRASSTRTRHDKRDRTREPKAAREQEAARARATPRVTQTIWRHVAGEKRRRGAPQPKGNSTKLRASLLAFVDRPDPEISSVLGIESKHCSVHPRRQVEALQCACLERNARTLLHHPIRRLAASSEREARISLRPLALRAKNRYPHTLARMRTSAPIFLPHLQHAGRDELLQLSRDAGVVHHRLGLLRVALHFAEDGSHLGISQDR